MTVDNPVFHFLLFYTAPSPGVYDNENYMWIQLMPCLQFFSNENLFNVIFIGLTKLNGNYSSWFFFSIYMLHTCISLKYNTELFTISSCNYRNKNNFLQEKKWVCFMIYDGKREFFLFTGFICTFLNDLFLEC